MEELLRQTKQIDLLVKEMEYQKRLKESLSAGAGDQDYVVTGMIAVFDENARLQRENKALKEELLDLRRQKLFNDEMYFEKLENDILCRKVQLHEIPLWLLRDPACCKTLYILAFRADRGSKQIKQFERDLAFLEAEIEAAEIRQDEKLLESLRWLPEDQRIMLELLKEEKEPVTGE